jgi:hypothetical protein
VEIKVGRNKYSNLSDSEYWAIKRYLKDNDKRWLEVSILKSPDFTPGMRRFIADLVTDKVARPAGAKPSVEVRNRQIVKGIFYLMKMGHKLTSGKDIEGAAAIMAKRFGVSEETAIGVYRNLKHDKEHIMQPGLEDVEYYNELPEPLKRGRKNVK